MNSIPDLSKVEMSALIVSARPPSGPGTASNLLIVGIEIPDASARALCDQPNNALAALICSVDTFGIGIDRPFMILLVSILLCCNYR